MGITQNDPKGLECVCCDHCKKIPTNVYYNQSLHEFQYAMRFTCCNCRTFWNVCKCCTVENQPPTFITYSLRQQINGRRLKLNDIISILDNSLVSHSLYHEESNVISNESFLSDDNSEHINNTSSNNIEVMVQDIISNMFETNTILSSFDSSLKEAILERETRKRYPDYLIKKYWLKNLECELHSSDVTMFLRHIRYILQQSRDDNNKLCFILSSYEKRNSQKYNSAYEQLEIEREKNAVTQHTIASLKSILEIHGIEYNIPQMDLGIDSNHVQISGNNDNPCFIRLKLPSCSTEIRQLLELKHSLLENILIPPITFHKGGMSWVKPSEALKQAICLGVPFEVVSGPNYSTVGLHERSIYRSSIISKLISESDIGDDVITVVFGFWSDGCYCGTESKGRRNQAKISTIHIDHHQVTERHVFPIMFGRKDDNDEQVKKHLLMT